MKIGFIGLGLMGGPMAANIVKKGYSCHAYDLCAGRIKTLTDLSAVGCRDGREVAEATDVVITMLPKSEDVRAVHESLYDVVKAGQIFIDMSTIDPQVSRGLAEEMKKRGARMLDAPVVKSRPAAVDGTLGIYVGGEEAVYEAVKDVLLCMGNNIIYLGGNGRGLIVKLAHNMLVAQIQNGVHETIAMAEKAGIDIDAFVKAISYGGGWNFYLETKGPAIKRRDFTTAFSVENMHKDVDLAVTLAHAYGLDLPGMELARRIYAKAMEAGYGKEDFSATYKVVSAGR